jgi:ferric-dicitrate binding protein FerR (iron transport regulator)
MDDIKNMHIEDLVAGYFSHSLSAKELKELKDWVNVSPENRKQFLTMKETWISSVSISDSRRFDKYKAFQRFLTHKTQGHEAASPKNSWKILWQSAAAVAALIIVSYFSFREGNKQTNARFSEMIKIEAPSGSTVKVYLPDGTLAHLNASSTITYSQTFGVNDRKVSLSGESYFEVAQNEKLPFSVQTEELQVDVLGTKFNLRNYPDDREASVCLLEGKVLVGNHIKPDGNITLYPDQKILLDKKNGDMRLTIVRSQNTAAWTNGHLFFDDALLSDIAKDLERSYNVTITLTHPDLENLRIYGRFIRKELNIEDVLEVLAATGKIKYNIKERKITLSPN